MPSPALGKILLLSGLELPLRVGQANKASFEFLAEGVRWFSRVGLSNTTQEPFRCHKQQVRIASRPAEGQPPGRRGRESGQRRRRRHRWGGNRRQSTPRRRQGWPEVPAQAGGGFRGGSCRVGRRAADRRHRYRRSTSEEQGGERGIEGGRGG